MRHAFRFPLHIRNAVKSHVIRAINAIDPNRYQQEPAFTIALAAKLEGAAYEGNDGFVGFTATAVNDRGPNSAESWSGADFAITATISDSVTRIQKAILIQAKLDPVTSLDPREKSRLVKQVQDMQRLTRSPKVMECPVVNAKRQPAMISRNRFAAGVTFRSMALADYTLARVLTTLDGDTRDSFVGAVQDSGLVGLKIRALLTQ